MEFTEMLKEFVRPELLALIPVLYFIGMWLKRAQTFADKYIPLALGGLGIALSALWVVATSPITGLQAAALAVFTAIVQGVLVAGCAVYIDQIKKQSAK